MKFAKLLATPEPPDLGPGPRPGVISEAALIRDLEELFRSGKFLPQKQNVIRALVLLWHDHLDSAHQIAQEADSPDGAFVHGIVHRREPDFGNAKYWFRRVGEHPAFPEIAARAHALLAATHSRELSDALAPGGRWNPFAFIDACERAAHRGGGEAELLREVQ